MVLELGFRTKLHAQGGKAGAHEHRHLRSGSGQVQKHRHRYATALYTKTMQVYESQHQERITSTEDGSVNPIQAVNAIFR